MIFCVERVHDFSHSLGLHEFFLWMLLDFFCAEVACFFCREVA